jgi:hypothetical protein
MLTADWSLAMPESGIKYETLKMGEIYQVQLQQNAYPQF